jgi:hypothetical protein
MSRLISIRDAVSNASMELGLAQQPVSAVVGSPDEDISQMAALLYAVADEVMLEEPYRTTFGDGLFLSTSAGEPLEKFTDDNDLILFDARLAIDGLKYQFMQAKGFEYGEYMRSFLTRLNKLASRVNAVVLDLDNTEDRER